MATVPKKQEFIKNFDNLQEVVDIDDSRGRSVPTNMNFIEEAYLTKDGGSSLFGAVETTLCHSDFNFQMKDGTEHRIRAKGTKLQEYNSSTGLWADIGTSPTFTADAEFGYAVYEDELWFGNGVESLYKWDGATTFTEYATAPKGNVLEIFEDRLFIAGVTAEPLSIYYSNVGDFTTYAGASILQPLGTDVVKTLKNYYGVLMIFKRDSIWKMTFVYDQVAAAFLPKLELQSGNYGAASRKSVVWVENDLWFYTGIEVRAIGFTDQQTGVFGINKSVLSEPIKETLKNIREENKDVIAAFYNNRRFYLAVPLGIEAENDTVFVCHLLYKNSWTKYTDRLKAAAFDFIEVDNVVYSSKSSGDYGTIKWDDNLTADNGTAVSSEVFFKKVENEDFNTANTYRYLDLLFKNLTATVTVTVREDANDNRTVKTKQFYIGSAVDGEENPLGEVIVGEHLIADAFGETVSSSPFLRRRVSFLSKAQSLTVGLSNANEDEDFTIAAYGLAGFKQPRRFMSISNITSM